MNCHCQKVIDLGLGAELYSDNLEVVTFVTIKPQARRSLVGRSLCIL